VNEESFKSSVDFPHPSLALAEGVIAVGGRLDVGTLYSAYIRGIFPWPQEDYPLLWFSPDKRGILEFKDFHVPNSLKKFRRQHPELTISFNRSFRQVIEECARQQRPEQNGTWITSGIKKAYCDFFESGFALSIEVRKDNILVGGIYGVLVRGIFSGESMFFKTSNASKIAFWELVEYLRSKGHEWMDIQMITPITEAFGGKYIHREEYLQKLRETQIAAGYTPIV
jgi:leucyl/phenylalanyl-tRNA--protein transferase